MTFNEFLNRYPNHAEEATERAAIKEYHGHVNRETAERQTMDLLRLKYDLFFQGDLWQ